MLHIEKYLNRTNPFIRFLLVGALNTIIGLSTAFFFLLVLEQNYWVSTFIGNVVGAVCSFLLNRSFTFESDVSYLYGGIRFLIIILLCYMIAYSIGPFIASVFPETVSERAAVLIGAAFYTILNYFGQKWVVFNKKRPQLN